jgi:hypothetical protein
VGIRLGVNAHGHPVVADEIAVFHTLFGRGDHELAIGTSIPIGRQLGRATRPDGHDDGDAGRLKKFD